MAQLEEVGIDEFKHLVSERALTGGSFPGSVMSSYPFRFEQQ